MQLKKKIYLSNDIYNKLCRLKNIIKDCSDVIGNDNNDISFQDRSQVWNMEEALTIIV